MLTSSSHRGALICSKCPVSQETKWEILKHGGKSSPSKKTYATWHSSVQTSRVFAAVSGANAFSYAAKKNKFAVIISLFEIWLGHYFSSNLEWWSQDCCISIGWSLLVRNREGAGFGHTIYKKFTVSHFISTSCVCLSTIFVNNHFFSSKGLRISFLSFFFFKFPKTHIKFLIIPISEVLKCGLSNRLPEC